MLPIGSWFVAEPPTTTGMWNLDLISLISLSAAEIFSTSVTEIRMISGSTFFT
jgi:hypothetical protein